MNPCPEEHEDWVHEVRETWPRSSPPLHLRPSPAPERAPRNWVWFLLPELCVVILVLALFPWMPQVESEETLNLTEASAWPDNWTQPEKSPERIGLHQRRQEEASQQGQTVFVTRRTDLRLRLQRAGRRLNPNPIGS